MTTCSDWYNIRSLENSAKLHGMKLAPSRISGRLALLPIKDFLPHYESSTELCTGDVDELSAFLAGWERSRIYLINLGIITDGDIRDAEQEIRADKLVDVLANGKA